MFLLALSQALVPLISSELSATGLTVLKVCNDVIGLDLRIDLVYYNLAYCYVKHNA